MTTKKIGFELPAVAVDKKMEEVKARRLKKIAENSGKAPEPEAASLSVEPEVVEVEMSDEELKNKIIGAESFEDLFLILRERGEIKGTNGEDKYPAEDIIKIVEAVRRQGEKMDFSLAENEFALDNLVLNDITRNFKVRDTVRKLILRESTEIYKKEENTQIENVKHACIEKYIVFFKSLQDKGINLNEHNSYWPYLDEFHKKEKVIENKIWEELQPMIGKDGLPIGGTTLYDAEKIFNEWIYEARDLVKGESIENERDAQIKNIKDFDELVNFLENESGKYGDADVIIDDIKKLPTIIKTNDVGYLAQHKEKILPMSGGLGKITDKIRELFDQEVKKKFDQEVKSSKNSEQDEKIREAREQLDLARQAYVKSDDAIKSHMSRFNRLKMFIKREDKGDKLGEFNQEFLNAKANYNNALTEYKNILVGELVEDAEGARIMADYLNRGEFSNIESARTDMRAENSKWPDKIADGYVKFIRGYKELSFKKKLAIGVALGVGGAASGAWAGAVVGGTILTAKRLLSMSVSSLGFQQMMEAGADKEREKESDVFIKKMQMENGLELDVEKLSGLLDQKISGIDEEIKKRNSEKNFRTARAAAYGIVFSLGMGELGHQIAGSETMKTAVDFWKDKIGSLSGSLAEHGLFGSAKHAISEAGSTIKGMHDENSIKWEGLHKSAIETERLNEYFASHPKENAILGEYLKNHSDVISQKADPLSNYIPGLDNHAGASGQDIDSLFRDRINLSKPDIIDARSDSHIFGAVAGVPENPISGEKLIDLEAIKAGGSIEGSLKHYFESNPNLVEKYNQLHPGHKFDAGNIAHRMFSEYGDQNSLVREGAQVHLSGDGMHIQGVTGELHENVAQHVGVAPIDNGDAYAHVEHAAGAEHGSDQAGDHLNKPGEAVADNHAGKLWQKSDIVSSETPAAEAPDTTDYENFIAQEKIDVSDVLSKSSDIYGHYPDLMHANLDSEYSKLDKLLAFEKIGHQGIGSTPMETTLEGQKHIDAIIDKMKAVTELKHLRESFAGSYKKAMATFLDLKNGQDDVLDMRARDYVDGHGQDKAVKIYKALRSTMNADQIRQFKLDPSSDDTTLSWSKRVVSFTLKNLAKK